MMMIKSVAPPITAPAIVALSPTLSSECPGVGEGVGGLVMRLGGDVMGGVDAAVATGLVANTRRWKPAN